MYKDLLFNVQWQEYCVASRKTCNQKITLDTKLLRYAGCLGEEFGEVYSILKKHWDHKHDLDMKKLENEFGDFMWYASRLYDLRHFTLLNYGFHIQSPQITANYIWVRIGKFVDTPNNSTFTYMMYLVINLASQLGVDIRKVLQGNLKKLQAPKDGRYKDGFSSTASKNRKEEK